MQPQRAARRQAHRESELRWQRGTEDTGAEARRCPRASGGSWGCHVVAGQAEFARQLRRAGSEAQTSVDFAGKLGLRQREGPLGVRRKQVAETCNLGRDASSPGFSDVESLFRNLATVSPRRDLHADELFLEHGTRRPRLARTLELVQLLEVCYLLRLCCFHIHPASILLTLLCKLKLLFI